VDKTASLSADYYREKAKQIRLYAGRVRTLEVALELLDIADRFERMAAYVERRPAWFSG
jgi:hypothetical protein